MKRHLTVKPVVRRATAVSAVVVVAVCVAAIGASSASALTAPDTTTGLTVSTTSTTAGQTITLTATVTGVGGAPPGMVEFDVNAIGGQTQIGSDVTLSPISGTQSEATLDTSFATGTYTVTATYRPDPASVFSFSTSTSGAVLLTIGSNQGAVFSTNLALSAAPDAGTPNTEDLTAHVSQVGGTGVPTGDVTFYANGVLLGQTTLVAGTATLSALSFIPGTYVITASYLGDANDLPVAAIPLTLAITGPSIAVQTTTTASATPSRITAGLAVVLNAHVAQVGTATQPVGNVVIFYANGNRLGQVQVDSNGNASLTVDGWLTGEMPPAVPAEGVTSSLPDTDGEATKRFFDRSEDEMRTADRAARKAARSARLTPRVLALRAGIALLVVLVVAGIMGGLLYAGYGYPTQEQTVSSLIDAYHKGGSYTEFWVAVPPANVQQEMDQLPAKFASYRISGVNRAARTSTVRVTVRLDSGAEMAYDVSLTREGVGWKVTGIKNAWSSSTQ